jgi:hypothetical protein
LLVFLCGLAGVWFGVDGPELAHALAFEFDPVGTVDGAIEDGVAKSWLADDLLPALDRQLASEEDRMDIVAILDDLKQVASLFSVELLCRG